MGTITLQIPQTSSPNSTEDPKIASDFTALQTVINGQLDTNNLAPAAGILGSQLAPAAGIVAGQLATGVVPNVHCHAFASAVLSLTNNTQTAIPYDTNRWDSTGMHSTSVNTSRITIATPGVYVATANATFASNATGVRTLAFRLNAAFVIASVVQASAGTADATAMQVTTIWKLNATDYLEVMATQTSGGALNVNAGSEFSVVQIATS